MSGVSLDAIEDPDVKTILARDYLQPKSNRPVKMEKQALSIAKRGLVQLACLLLLFVALRAVARAPAQASAENQNTLATEQQLLSVPSDNPHATRASPAASCQGGPLYDQYNNAATEPPVGIGSQKFEPAMAAFDDQAADDFVLTSGLGGIYINGVRVMGEYSAGGGPAASFNVYFYQNGAGNLPGSLIRVHESALHRNAA
jgi:hypothetical protein